MSRVTSPSILVLPSPTDEPCSSNIANSQAVQILSGIFNSQKKLNHKKNGKKKGGLDVDALWRKKGILINKDKDESGEDNEILENGKIESSSKEKEMGKTKPAVRSIKTERQSPSAPIPVKALADTPITAVAQEAIIIDKHAFQAVKSVLAPKGIIRLTTSEERSEAGKI
ncbi:hypothetical protein WR25_03085 [Diploscapter pachys]|uniref:Uncharacterized protein n=1 Tax=Diploscapter pachys TaxID=2018661 RepID=A0A2A2L680_9BILA|nr:hypothetical protein WR25_03085 [Diploscapter pachys]